MGNINRKEEKYGIVVQRVTKILPHYKVISKVGTKVGHTTRISKFSKRSY